MNSWRVVAALASGFLALLMSGCGAGGGLYDMPLPGGADVGDDPITLTADFTDVVDLVPQSSVKVDNIAVGRVSRIELNPDGRSARVTLVVRGDLGLPEHTAARLQQTSLLGEKYVALVRPADASASDDGRLREGSHIGLAATSQVAEVEQVLGAVSTVLNGGGIGKFQEISRELQKVSVGRPEEIRGFLRSTEVFVAGLEHRKQAITDALDAVNGLSGTLEADNDKIATALEGLSPGMQVLVEQRGDLVAMLESLDRLSTVTTRTLDAAQEDMIEDFKLLEPILEELAAAGAALPNSLQMLLTYPFPDAVLATIQGDYLNVFVTTNYGSLPPGCAAMGCPWPQDTEWAIDPGRSRKALEPVLPTPSPSARESDAPGPGDPEDPDDPGGSDGTGEESTDPGDEGGDPGDDGTPTPPTPSPTLLPPTDSPLPGIAQPTVQVPRQVRTGLGRN